MTRFMWANQLVGSLDPNNSTQMAQYVANLKAAKITDVNILCGRWQAATGTIATSGGSGSTSFAYQLSDADLKTYISYLQQNGFNVHAWIESDALSSAPMDITNSTVFNNAVASVTAFFSRFPTLNGFHEDNENITRVNPQLANWYNACADAAHTLGKYYTVATDFNTWDKGIYPLMTHCDGNLIMFYTIFDKSNTQGPAAFYSEMTANLGCPTYIGIMVGYQMTQSLAATLAVVTNMLAQYPNPQIKELSVWIVSTMSTQDPYDGTNDWTTLGNYVFTTPITPTYILNWTIKPTNGNLPFTITFSGYLSRSNSNIDIETVMNGENIQLQILPPGGTIWSNVGVTATTGSDSSGYTGYFNGSYKLVEPTIYPGSWQFRAFYAGNTSKGLFGAVGAGSQTQESAPKTPARVSRKRYLSGPNGLIL